ncbi:MAG: class I SAM-dependent methyltransferase [Bdellovibrionota bacterium]
MDATTATPPVQLHQDHRIGSASQAKRGSALIRYDHCNKYDMHRRPIGISRLARWIRSAGERLSLPLDAMKGTSFCCGTGLNEAELLKQLESNGERLGHLLCADASNGMLEFAPPKLEPFKSGWDTRQLDVVRDEFKFENPLDFAMCVQATQHLDRRGDHSNVRIFFRKVRNALVSGGSFFVIISTPDQVRHPHWFINVMSGRPGIAKDEDPGEHFALEHTDLSVMAGLLEESGFAMRKHRVLPGPHFKEESYFGDPRIAQDDEFRHASSFFWIAKERGLISKYDQVLADLIESGEIDAHREACERQRLYLGVSCLIEAVAT